MATICIYINIELSNKIGHCEVVHTNCVQHYIQPPDMSSTVNKLTINVMETGNPPRTNTLLFHVMSTLLQVHQPTVTHHNGDIHYVTF